MADTFFGFDASLNNGDHLLPPDDDDCIENEEEEYDALNNETFGGLGDSATLDDWEQQHEQFAKFAESTKHSDDLESSITRLMMDDGDPEPLSLSKNSVWSYTPPVTKNRDVNSQILLTLLKGSKSFIESHVDSNKSNESLKAFGQSTPLSSTGLSPIHQIPKQIHTVEELEKSLIKNSNHMVGQQSQMLANKPLPPPPGHLQHPPFPHPMFSVPPPGQLPPGPGNPKYNMPPQMRRMGMPPPPHHQMPPPGMMHMMPPPPPFMQGGPPRHPGPMYVPRHPAFPVNHPFNFPPPPRNMPPPNPNQMNRTNQNHFQHPQLQQQQRPRVDNLRQRQELPMPYHHLHHHQPEIADEYAGLMTSREKQWLLNIQMLQLNTSTPYFDDYYYTVFKERKVDNNRDHYGNDGRNHRYQNNNRQQRNNDRQQDSSNTLTPRIYTPLQFENSLGKLQCGSVTAPRKIIDMDIVTPEKESEEGSAGTKDTRKTKQLLLELEALYTLLLKAEDLSNPMAISNMEKLREMKQKQRLREIEFAPTPEQKQEVLKLFKQESEPVNENPMDYICRIVAGLLQDDKFSSFLNVRKGKMLLLRLLPHLTPDNFAAQLLEIWTKVLLGIAVVGRRDTSGDHILPKLHPFFKRYVQSNTMNDILDITSVLLETARQENHRATPLSHQGKAPLYFVLSNKFGVSALATLLIRMEYLLSSEKASDKQQNDWSNFLLSWAELTALVNKVACPLEPVPKLIFSKHCNRFDNLTPDKRSLLEQHFVELD